MCAHLVVTAAGTGDGAHMHRDVDELGNVVEEPMVRVVGDLKGSHQIQTVVDDDPGLGDDPVTDHRSRTLSTSITPAVPWRLAYAASVSSGSTASMSRR